MFRGDRRSGLLRNGCFQSLFGKNASAEHIVPVVSEALRKAGIQKGSKSFFLGAALALEAGVPLEEAWLQSTSALSALREDDRAQLRFLAAQLGRYDAKTQAERLEACVEALRASVDGVREESRRNAKLSVSLSLVIGLMLAVVLY